MAQVAYEHMRLHPCGARLVHTPTTEAGTERMQSTPSCPKSAAPPLAAAACPATSISAAALLISMRLRRSKASGLFAARPGAQTQRRLLFCALVVTIWACREHRQHSSPELTVQLPEVTPWACREHKQHSGPSSCYSACWQRRRGSAGPRTVIKRQLAKRQLAVLHAGGNIAGACRELRQ